MSGAHPAFSRSRSPQERITIARLWGARKRKEPHRWKGDLRPDDVVIEDSALVSGRGENVGMSE